MTPPVTDDTALFLDVDGTILDMARSPDAVVVPRDLQEALTRLRQKLSGALAFVSGRSLATLDALFAPMAAIGCHGVEVRGQDGAVLALSPPLSRTVRDIFNTLAQAHPGVLLEDKDYSLALHYRLAPEAKSALLAAMDAHKTLFAAEHIAILQGKAVIDARPLGIDKGVGVRALMRQAPFAGRKPLFGGDDTTDLDVFKILPELGGLGFSVGKRLPGAAFMFTKPLAVRQWLCGMAGVAS